MLKLLLVVAVLAVVAVLVRRSRRNATPEHASSGASVSQARAEKLAAEQAVISRQGGQGAGQGGFGGSGF